jgi:hypothetical protein
MTAFKQLKAEYDHLLAQRNSGFFEAYFKHFFNL